MASTLINIIYYININNHYFILLDLSNYFSINVYNFIIQHNNKQ